MQTLFFRVMTPIYSAHMLAPQEQADLMTFLKQAETKPQSKWDTQIMILSRGPAEWLFRRPHRILLERSRQIGTAALIYKATVKERNFELDQRYRQPKAAALGRVLPQPLAARQSRAQHARGELHGWLLVEHLCQEWHRHLGDAGARLSKAGKQSAAV